MKKVLTILISIILVALLIFCVHSCIKKDENPVVPQVSEPNVSENQPNIDNPNTEEDDSSPSDDESVVDSSKVFTEIGIFNGKIDSFSIEVAIGSNMSIVMPYRLSPEVAEKLPSYNLEIGSIISFEYQEIDGQSVITKIIQ